MAGWYDLCLKIDSMAVVEYVNNEDGRLPWNLGLRRTSFMKFSVEY